VRFAILVVVLGALASWLLVIHGGPHSVIAIADLRVREVAGRAVVDGTISNRGIYGDRLVRLSSGLADKVLVFDDRGREADYLRVPADSELVLGGNAPHIEAIGLKRSLKADELLPLLFVFERAGQVRVNARVEVTPGVSQK
jgi:copper(I)-binding protein